jgi:Zn-dependent protease with chaperone function
VTTRDDISQPSIPPAPPPPLPRQSRSQWEGNPRWLVAVLGIFLIVLLAAYWYGIPLVASVVARQVPASLTESLSSQVLAILDSQVFTPSEISRTRQDAIRSEFRRLDFDDAASGGQYQIVFRKSDQIGANAVALPSGIIVVTDALVTLAADDREILGVLAHEAGHVEGRHGLRNLLQNSLVGLLLAWILGDVSTLAAAAPRAFIEAGYSRDLEREADAFAVNVLRRNGIAVRHFADMLRRLDQAGGVSDSGGFQYLSSHPATSERLRRLETQ